MQEQLIVILTTTLSLLTAWSWNSVLQQYIDQYYGRSLSTRMLSAVVVTVITFLLINWLLRHFPLVPNKLAHVTNTTDISRYAIKKQTEQHDQEALLVS